ncbi:MAG: PQQ-binding-like beta-propeller repeat protein [Halanaeroarchaeum sp.]
MHALQSFAPAQWRLSPPPGVPRRRRRRRRGRARRLSDRLPPPLTLDRWWRQYAYDAANTAYNPDAEGPSADPDPVEHWTHRAGTYRQGDQPLAIPAGTLVDTGSDGVFLLDGGGDVDWRDDGDYGGLTPAAPDSLLLATGYGFRGVSREGGVSLLGWRTGYEHFRTHAAAPASPPSFDGHFVVAGIGSGHTEGGGRVTAFDARSGERLWRAPVETSVKGAPALDDQRVYAADLGQNVPTGENTGERYAYAFDRETGQELWRTPLTGDPWASVSDAVVVGDGLVFVAAGPGGVYALDAETGEVAGTKPIGPVQASPALADGVLYVATMSDGIYALEAASGETKWQRSFPAVSAAPIVVGDRLYVLGREGHVAAFERDGTLAWDHDVPGTVRAPPLVDHRTVYVGATSGTLTAIGEPS